MYCDRPKRYNLNGNMLTSVFGFVIPMILKVSDYLSFFWKQGPRALGPVAWP